MTGADIVATGWKGTPAMSFFKGVGGSSVRVPFRQGLAAGRVRFVGEPVAVVVAEHAHLAQDAAELIRIEYEDLPVIVEASGAMADGASSCTRSCPTIWHSITNTATARRPSRALPRPRMSFASAVRAQRIAGNPMEPKSCLALYDAANEAVRSLPADARGRATCGRRCRR